MGGDERRGEKMSGLLIPDLSSNLTVNQTERITFTKTKLKVIKLLG